MRILVVIACAFVCPTILSAQQQRLFRATEVLILVPGNPNRTLSGSLDIRTFLPVTDGEIPSENLLLISLAADKGVVVWKDRDNQLQLESLDIGQLIKSLTDEAGNPKEKPLFIEKSGRRHSVATVPPPPSPPDPKFLPTGLRIGGHIVTVLYFQPETVKAKAATDTKPTSVATPPQEAFPTLPVVEPLAPPTVHSDSDAQASDAARVPSLWERVKKDGLHHLDRRWDGPAHFPLPRFGRCGEPMEGDGVLIHEGMRFLAIPDGHYEVTFTVSAPDMPATLRMQIGFEDDFGLSFGLTLPPMVVDVRRSFLGNDPSGSYRIRHEGYSRLVKERFEQLNHARISRKGTARFGSWPEGINQFGDLPLAGFVPHSR